MSKTIVMSLGGSLIAPNGIDAKFLTKFKQIILSFIKTGNRVVIICGGGNTSRYYTKTAESISPRVSSRELDYIGIMATRLNGELVRSIFGDFAKEGVIGDPTKKVITNKKIIVGAGWLPGHSSDKDAVEAAKTFGAKTVINLSNIKYVYDKDPKKFKDAKPQKQMTWKAFLKMVGSEWVPGAHVPFDPVASHLAAKYRMELIVMRGSDLENLKKFLAGKRFVGTVVS